MVILGISNNDCAGACLVVNGEIIAAASEERFTRLKGDNVFPYNSIAYVLSEAKLDINDIDKFAYGWAAGFHKDKHLELYFDRIVEACNFDPSSIPILKKRLIDEIKNDNKKREEFDLFLENKGVTEKAYFIDHHESHANAAMLCSPFEEGLSISCDGRGDFQSLTVSSFSNNKFKVLQRETTFDSLGFFYGRITAYLGFKPNKHEGKITGLAAHGSPGKLLHKMTCLIDINEEGRIRGKYKEGYLPSYHCNYDLMDKLFFGDKPEDIAAAAQQHLEDILAKIVASYTTEKQPVNLCLSGGVFGNVKLNQRLREMKGVKNIFVLPPMGDDGLPLGSAVCAYFELTGVRARINSMCLGPNVQVGKEVTHKLQIDPEITVTKADTKQILKLVLSGLKTNKVIGLIRGRMEFGPRALGNRSIICSAKDISINTWLNKRMNRTEFMPFAPIVADKFASDCFVDWKREHIASKFMTATYDCTDYFSKACPAVTHIDNTARPQIVTAKSDPLIYQILCHWEKQSGEPALINTSFNMHEEPIVLNIEHALSNLKKGVVDILVVNDALVIYRAKDS